MNTPKAPPEDLRPILLGLIGSGMTQAQIAREIGLSRATVNMVVKRSSTWTPRYATGARLIALDAERINAIGSKGKRHA